MFFDEYIKYNTPNRTELNKKKTERKKIEENGKFMSNEDSRYKI